MELENKDILQNENEQIVLVDWIKAADSESDGYWEKGLQSLSNTLYQLSNDYTYNKVLEHFEIIKKK